jgi:hypothetical protein
MYFLHKYEYGTLKPVEITIRSGGERGTMENFTFREFTLFQLSV